MQIVIKTMPLSAEETRVSSLLSRLRRNDDDGLSMVEMMAAIVVFAIASSGLVMGIVYSKKSVRDSRLRVQAAQLASRESEIVRNEFTTSNANAAALGTAGLVTNPHPLAGGTAGQPLVVDNTPFTVQRTTEWMPAGAGSSACDGGATVTYPELSVHIEVTWPAMTGTKPVVTNTILTPPKNTINANASYVAVKVTGASGSGTSGVPITLSGASGPFVKTSDSDGCTVFQVTALGSYTVTLNTSGYVTSDSQTNASKSISVAAATIQQVPFTYDRAVTINTTMVTASGYALPAGLMPVTAYNSGMSNPTISFPSSAATNTLTNLWPFTTGYSLWASSCTQADPAPNGGTRKAGVPLTPGANVSDTVNLSPVGITVKDGSGNPVTGATVIATPVTTTNCGTTENPLTLGNTDTTGLLKTSIPAGQYKLTVSGRSGTVTTSSFNSYTTPTAYLLTVS